MQQQQQATDQTANFFWMLALLTIGILLVWWLGKSYVVSILFFIREYEILFIKASLTVINDALSFFHLPQIGVSKLNFWSQFMKTTPLGHINFADVGAMSSTVGRYLRYPIIVILLALSAKMFFRSKTQRFRHGHSMSSLKKSGGALWPQILPAMTTEASKEKLEEGPWAMAQLPLNYCKKHGLIEVVSDGEEQLRWVLKKELAEHSFIMQMGSPWQGVHALPLYIKALLVIFVARIQREYELADRLLEQVAKSSSSAATLNFDGVNELASRYKEADVLHWLEQKHAYVGTLMPSLLEIARISGVLASSEFLWLKPVDRRLWYILNAVGRQTPVVEVAGLFSHWIAEKTLRRRLRVPMVQAAVLALETEVNNILYTEREEERWDTKRGA